jgi:hypothetical protein
MIGLSRKGQISRMRRAGSKCTETSWTEHPGKFQDTTAQCREQLTYALWWRPHPIYDCTW